MCLHQVYLHMLSMSYVCIPYIYICCLCRASTHVFIYLCHRTKYVRITCFENLDIAQAYLHTSTHFCIIYVQTSTCVYVIHSHSFIVRLYVVCLNMSIICLLISIVLSMSRQTYICRCMSYFFICMYIYLYAYAPLCVCVNVCIVHAQRSRQMTDMSTDAACLIKIKPRLVPNSVFSGYLAHFCFSSCQ